jgi:hypothetical protein
LSWDEGGSVAAKEEAIEFSYCLLEHICRSIDTSKEVWGNRQGVAIIFGFILGGLQTLRENSVLEGHGFSRAAIH